MAYPLLQSLLEYSSPLRGWYSTKNRKDLFCSQCRGHTDVWAMYPSEFGLKFPSSFPSNLEDRIDYMARFDGNYQKIFREGWVRYTIANRVLDLSGRKEVIKKMWEQGKIQKMIREMGIEVVEVAFGTEYGNLKDAAYFLIPEERAKMALWFNEEL